MSSYPCRYGSQCRTRNCKYDHSSHVKRNSNEVDQDGPRNNKRAKLDDEDKRRITHQKSLSEDDLKLYELQDLFPNADVTKIQKYLAMNNFDVQKCIESLFQSEMNSTVTTTKAESNTNNSNTNSNRNGNSNSNSNSNSNTTVQESNPQTKETPQTTTTTTSTSTSSTSPSTPPSTPPTSTSTTTISELAEDDEEGSQCAICLERKKIDFMFIMQDCNHVFCRECAGGYFKSKINDRVFPIKCPNYGCKKEATELDIEMVLDKQMIDKYAENSFRNAIRKNPTTFSCCPTPDCPYIFFFTTNDSPDFGCPTCKKRYCLNCRVAYHTGSTCEAYQKWSLENGMSDDLFGDFVRGHKFKQCAGCKHWVEKTEGCNHMSCTCGYEFCYKCGGQYDGGCSCNDEDEEDEDDERDEYDEDDEEDEDDERDEYDEDDEENEY